MTIPRATYRLQLHAGFDFAAAAGVAEYMAALGVSHLYASPYLQAVPGSTHGYDVVDPRRVNRELGGEEGHAGLLEALGKAGLGQILDIVPNHMALAGPENPWWWDVLRNGPSSFHAPKFDVDWNAPEEKLRGQILLPVLGDHFGRVLEEGELRLEREGADLRIRYHDHLLPLSPWSVGTLLEPVAEARLAGPEGSDELGFLARSLRRLPDADSVEVRERRHRDLNVLRGRLEALLEEDEGLGEAVDAALASASSDPDLMENVLEVQHYRLSYWRAGARELDYRRFFDIDTLVGVKVEDPAVFQATHVRILQWLEEGVLDGVRVDHPDGLRRPEEYFRRLREAAPDAWIVAEKILEPGEPLPEDWPVDGTTGYDFLNDVGGLFVDPGAREPILALYTGFTGESADFEAVVHARKLQILREVLPADLNRLAHVFVDVCEGRRRYRDFTRHELREALLAVVTSYPVYRSYVDEDGNASERDRALIPRVVAEARERRPDLDEDLFTFLQGVLLGEVEGHNETELRMRLQQLTGPVMAKAVEDTTFYAWVPFVALNEVGGAPHRFGVEPEAFHRRCRKAVEAGGRSMLGLSTHDTKRSEDVRARLFLLSEMPERWAEVVRELAEAAAPFRRGEGLPSRNAEYLLYQTLVGAHPLSAERAREYMEKASREAKSHTSWTDPVEAYDEALAAFVTGALEDPEFRRRLDAFAGGLVGPGRINALAQKLIQLTAPGVPDLYQGTELWDLSLVDPDNRRPVDFEGRRALLREIEDRALSPEAIGDGGARGDGGGLPLTPEEIRRRGDEGLPKLWVVRQALALRAERQDALGPAGDYKPLHAEGPGAQHVVAFARGGDVVTVTPRLILGLARSGGWRDTHLELPPGSWRNRLTGERVRDRVLLRELLRRFPVALLATEGKA